MAEGYVAPGFERVAEAFEAGLADELGAGFAAVRNGEILVDIWGGWADRAQTKPWMRDTIVPSIPPQRAWPRLSWPGSPIAI